MIYEVFGKLPKWAIQNSNLWPLPCESDFEETKIVRQDSFHPVIYV